MSRLGTGTSSGSGGGGSSTITTFLGSTTSGPVNITQVGSAAFSLGQQLAAASLPVVLTAAQLTTLTPPAAITGFATSAKQDTGNTSLSSIDGKITAVNTGAVVVASGSITANAGTNLNTSALLTSSDFAAAFGTAGTADAQVMSVQGIASMTPVQVSQATGTNLHMVVDSGTITTVSAVTAITNALPAGTNAIGKLSANSGVDIGDVDVTSSALPTGASTLAEQQSQTTSLQLIDDTVFTDDTSTHTPATTKVIGIGMVADSTSTDSVNEGDIGMPRMTLDRQTVVSVTPTAEVNGLSVFNATSSDGATALTNSAQAIKASAGQLYGWYIYNPNTSAQFVQLYNTAAGSVTVGTTSPLFMLTIPASSGANVEFTNGITFSNAGWSAAATSTAGGNGAPTTALDAVFFYK